MRLHPLVRILRPALAPTAAADVLAAAAFGGGGPFWSVLLAALGSCCLYMGGMAQNDFCDRERDRKLFPDRPLVKEPRLVIAAGLLAFGLYVAGVVMCGLAGAVWPALAVVVLASTYNFGAKRRFPYDAIVLGGARAANLWVGLAVAGVAFDSRMFTYLAAYLLYIGAITIASRAEDMEPVQTRRLTLMLSMAPVLLALGAFWSLARTTGALYLVPAALMLFWLVRAMLDGSREAAMKYVLRSLMMIFLLHAICLYTVHARPPIASIGVCAALSFFLLGAMSPRKQSKKSGPPAATT